MIHILLNAKTLGKVFKASGGDIKLTKSKKSIEFLFEVIRREKDWEKKFVEKMKFYKDFYDNFVPGDSGFDTIPQLILVCEDDKHMAETFKQMVLNDISFKKINIYYTTDLKQISESLEKSLTEFKLNEKTNKYKANVVELKILGM